MYNTPYIHTYTRVYMTCVVNCIVRANGVWTCPWPGAQAQWRHPSGRPLLASLLATHALKIFRNLQNFRTSEQQWRKFRRWKDSNPEDFGTTERM